MSFDMVSMSLLSPRTRDEDVSSDEEPTPGAFLPPIPETASEVDERVYLIAESRPNLQSKSTKTDKSESDTSIGWDVCAWYMRNPIEHLPILYFFAYCLAVPLLSIFWFMEQEIAYLITGPLVLTMCIHAIHRFKTSVKLRSEVGKFQKNNHEMRVQMKLLETELDRFKVQREALKDAEISIVQSFRHNEENIEKFEQIDERLKVFGAQHKGRASDVMRTSVLLNTKLKEQKKERERDMMFAAYNMMERQRTDRKDFGMTDFEEFQMMLPTRMKGHFLEKTQFDQLVNDRSILNYESFVDIMDIYCMLVVLLIYIFVKSDQSHSDWLCCT